MDSPAIFAAEFEEAGDLGGDVYSAEFGGAGEAWFTLTREDIFDHIADMNGDKLRFPVDAFGVARDKKRGMPASLQCGGRSFGFLYGLTAVKLTLRCPDSLARDLLTRYTGARHAAVPVGWFDFIIDRSVKSKREVFDVLDECYLYTMSLFYGADGAGYTHGNDTAAEAELVDNLALIADSLGSPDPLYAAAVEERRRAAADFAARYPAALGITVERLLRFTRKHLPDADIIERTKWYMPVSLRCGKRTFAIIYPRRAGISLTLRISDEYAAYLIRRHPLVRRARWPRTRNWYIVPLDGTFRHTPEIFRTLQRAHTYLKTGFTR
jgi:predicted DNA-binding protein (MmcQ/YjbR family)